MRMLGPKMLSACGMCSVRVSIKVGVFLCSYVVSCCQHAKP